jgi:hypothetical protein
MAEFDDVVGCIHNLVDVVTTRSTSNGAFVARDAIEFRRNDDAGVGVFATAPLAAGTVLVTVPFSECISAEAVMATAVGREVVGPRPGLLQYQDEVIALGLMYAVTLRARGDEDAAQAACPWMAHVKTLPASYNTPLFWSEEELAELKGYNTFHLTNLMKKQIAADWEALHQPLSEEYPELLGGATLEVYQWALSTVYSRAVGVVRKGVYTRCVPPIVDMANHSPDAGSDTAETLRYDVAKDTVSLVTTTSRAAGEECYAVYGRYPNGKLLYSYGFVVPHSPHRAIDLWTRVTPSVSNAEAKQQLLLSHDLTREQTYDFTGTLRGFDGAVSVSPALLATVRVIQVADAAEMENVENAFRGEMVSVRNERASYVALRALLVNALKVHTAEEDKATLGQLLLGDTKRCDRRLMALVLRVEERELVQDCLTLVDTWVAQLDDLGEAYVPPDSPLLLPKATDAAPGAKS